MSQGLEVDIRELVLANSSFGPQEIAQLATLINEDYNNFVTLRDAVGELEVREERSPATAARLGVCYYLLGRYLRAEETLGNSDGGALALFYTALTKRETGRLEEALEKLEEARRAGYDADRCSLARAKCLLELGNAEESLKILDDLFGPIEQTAEYLAQRAATVAALGGNSSEVVALYERAVETDPRHPGALFGLALENDRHGNDREALDLYQRAASCFPTHLGCLLNLGILYEDNEQYEKAKQCYDRILDVYPNHPRARLYIRDAAASGDVFDEESHKARDKISQVLNIPVTDFELSVRSRNCLQKMGVRTLGDLTRTTEQELLASKNFGETSLIEIREILTAKGLELGQFAHERSAPEPAYDTRNMSPDEQALLDRPIADLNLSVRARKCMVRLSLNTIGELIRKTGDDLLECKNFGVTSLNEVRDKLAQLNLKLRGD